MKRSLLVSIVFVMTACCLVAGCKDDDKASEEYIFSEEQTYRVSEDQLDSLSNANVQVDLLREMQLVAAENSLYIHINQKIYAFSVIRLPPPPPSPCQCRILFLIFDKDENQILARTTASNQLFVFEAEDANSPVFENMENLQIDKLRLDYQ